MNKDIRTALIIAGVIVAAVVIVSIFGGIFSGWGGYGVYGMMGPWMMGSTGWGWFMPILMIVFWGLVIWAIVALVRGLSSGGGGSRQEESALDMLKKRYARGEISKEEYEAKKKDIL